MDPVSLRAGGPDHSAVRRLWLKELRCPIPLKINKLRMFNRERQGYWKQRCVQLKEPLVAVLLNALAVPLINWQTQNELGRINLANSLLDLPAYALGFAHLQKHKLRYFNLSGIG